MTVTHVLELTEEELTVIHCLLVFMDTKQVSPATWKLEYGPVDQAFKSALAKTTGLMAMEA